MSAPVVPHRRCRVIDTDRAMEEIRAFLEHLIEEGERPWCEVWYPAPEHRNSAHWEHRQAETFDAVELVDGEIVTLPPYAELIGGA